MVGDIIIVDTHQVQCLCITGISLRIPAHTDTLSGGQLVTISFISFQLWLFHSAWDHGDRRLSGQLLSKSGVSNSDIGQLQI